MLAVISCETASWQLVECFHSVPDWRSQCLYSSSEVQISSDRILVMRMWPNGTVGELKTCVVCAAASGEICLQCDKISQRIHLAQQSTWEQTPPISVVSRSEEKGETKSYSTGQHSSHQRDKNSFLSTSAAGEIWTPAAQVLIEEFRSYIVGTTCFSIPLSGLTSRKSAQQWS